MDPTDEKEKNTHAQYIARHARHHLHCTHTLPAHHHPAAAEDDKLFNPFDDWLLLPHGRTFSHCGVLGLLLAPLRAASDHPLPWDIYTCHFSTLLPLQVFCKGGDALA